jgi:hypothetical protein
MPVYGEGTVGQPGIRELSNVGPVHAPLDEPPSVPGPLSAPPSASGLLVAGGL